MPATLNATPGAPTANSYADDTFVSTYMDERATAEAWVAATPDQRTRAMIAATRRLDRERYTGAKTGGAQALQWPRTYATNPDAAYGASAYHATDSIPARLKRAQCGLAYAILSGTYSGEESGLDAFVSVKVGDLEVEPRESTRSDELPDDVRQEIAPLLFNAGGTFVRLVRG